MEILLLPIKNTFFLYPFGRDSDYQVLTQLVVEHCRFLGMEAVSGKIAPMQYCPETLRKYWHNVPESRWVVGNWTKVYVGLSKKYSGKGSVVVFCVFVFLLWQVWVYGI